MRPPPASRPPSAARTLPLRMPAASEQAAIIEMARTSIPVLTCIRRLTNWCLSNGVEITEGSGRLNEEFGRIVKPAYTTFLRDALEAMFVCGFVPWFVAEHDGARFAKVLPLGCFAWHVEVASQDAVGAHMDGGKDGGTAGGTAGGKDSTTHGASASKRRRVSDVYRYRVTMLHGDIEDSRVRIIDWLPPRPSATASPLHEIFEAYSELAATRAQLRDVATHNSRKHVYFTEQIAPGQLGSTGGLNLLDEFRRYTLTGKPSMVPPHMRMWSNDGRRLESVNDAHLHWIRNEFEDSTTTHVLPPNVEAHEMQPIPVDDYLVNRENGFQHMVHAFFNLPYSTARASVNDQSTQHEQLLSEEQYTNIRSLCNFLQATAEQTYSAIFSAPRVQVRLRARPRLTMNSADDVKKLFECGVFTQRDVFQLRTMFLQQ